MYFLRKLVFTARERGLTSDALFSKGGKINTISTTCFSRNAYPPSSTVVVSLSSVKGSKFAHKAVGGLQRETTLFRHDQAHRPSCYCSSSPPTFSSCLLPSRRPPLSSLKTPRQGRMRSVLDLVEKEGERKSELLFSLSPVPGDSSASGTSSVCQNPHLSEKLSVPADTTTSSDMQRKSSFVLPTAADQLAAQHGCLRKWFSDAHNGLNVVYMKKKKELYLSECKEFAKAHNNKWPTEKEVSHNVAVELAPVAALKTWGYMAQKRNARTNKGHLNGNSSSPGHYTVTAALQDALLLQQHVRQHQIIQSQGKTWFRCLRCFHIFNAIPHRLLTSPRGNRNCVGKERANGLHSPIVELSWVAKKTAEEASMLHCGTSAPSSTNFQNTSLRSLGVAKSKQSRNAQKRKRKEKEKNEPHACPYCGSVKIQWMLEYVHHRTHIS